MRIAMAFPYFTGVGGVERYVLESSQRLATKHQVTIYTNEYAPTATYPGLAQFPIVTIPRGQWATTRLNEDVIFAHDPGPNLLAYHNKRVAYCLHSFIRDSAIWRPDLMLRRLLDQGAMKRNQRILANSQYTATRFQAIYHRSVTDVIYGGIDPDYFTLPPTAGNYALYVGRLSPEKGLDRLIAWWQSINYDLLLVGAGPPAYLHTLQQQNRNPRIRIVAPRFGQDLASTYQHCRFMVLLPLVETLGLALMEAQATAKPVIAANVGGPAEMVLHGHTGFLVNTREEFCQAVAHLIASEETCHKMGAAGRQHMQPFTWDNIAKHIEQIAQQMIKT
jgi:glycosyltransferase involved in cell wall biosynthesis